MRESKIIVHNERFPFHCCSIKKCRHKKGNGRCSLTKITFAMNEDCTINYSKCYDFYR